MPRGGDANEKKTLMQGVLVLMPAALFTKFVGLFYKIPLLFIVGVEGMAYFLAAYHIYSLLFVLSSTGLPTALSLQIARAVATGEGRTTRRIFGVAMGLFLSIGLAGSAALLIFAQPLADRLAMGEAAASVVAIAPALVLCAFLGAGKGYFQGHTRMGTTALCEVLEAAGKLCFGLAFALFAKRAGYDTPVVAAFAIFGITAGLALAALVLLGALLRDAWKRRGASRAQKGPLPTRRAVLFSLCRVALPITVSASVMSLTALLDTALISARLQAAGFSSDVANAMYSAYGNLAIPLYNLVPSLLAPITLALMPLLGAFASRGDFERGRETLCTAVRITALISIPAALGLGVFSRPLLSMIFAGQGEAVAVAAPLLSMLSVSVVPSALLALTGAALQAIGHTVLPVVAMGAGACVKLTVECVLLTLPQCGILGAPVSTLACTLTVLLIEWAALSRHLPFAPIAPRNLLRPFLCALPGVLAGAALYFWARIRLGGEPRWLMPAILALVVVLVLPTSLLGRAVEKEDLLALPAGEGICRFFEKCKLLK